MAPGRRRGGAGFGADDGAVTAELAVGLPAVIAVLALVLATASVGVLQLRCADGARAGARVAALGEPDAVVAQVARRVAGPGATVDVRRDPPWVEVTVTAGPRSSWVGSLPTPRVTATAWAEP